MLNELRSQNLSLTRCFSDQNECRLEDLGGNCKVSRNMASEDKRLTMQRFFVVYSGRIDAFKTPLPQTVTDRVLLEGGDEGCIPFDEHVSITHHQRNGGAKRSGQASEPDLLFTAKHPHHAVLSSSRLVVSRASSIQSPSNCVLSVASMQGMDESLLVVLAWFVRRSDAGSLRMEDLWACCQADGLFCNGKTWIGISRRNCSTLGQSSTRHAHELSGKTWPRPVTLNSRHTQHRSTRDGRAGGAVASMLPSSVVVLLFV